VSILPRDRAVATLALIPILLLCGCSDSAPLDNGYYLLSVSPRSAYLCTRDKVAVTVHGDEFSVTGVCNQGEYWIIEGIARERRVFVALHKGTGARSTLASKSAFEDQFGSNVQFTSPVSFIAESSWRRTSRRALMAAAGATAAVLLVWSVLYLLGNRKASRGKPSL